MVNILTLSFGPREHMDSSSSQTAAGSWYGIEGCYFLIEGGNFPEKAVARTQQTVSLTGVRDKQVYMIG